jgi:hypothetical protein
MRPKDLIPTFTDWLRDLDDGVYSPLIKRADAWMALDADDWAEMASEMTGKELQSKLEEDGFILEELFEALDSFSPPHCYFGASEGDGACYGWWVSQDSLKESCRDGEVLKVSDLSEVPPDYTGEVLHVTDHGNETLYTAQNGKLEEVWGIV